MAKMFVEFRSFGILNEIRECDLHMKMLSNSFSTLPTCLLHIFFPSYLK